MCQSWAYTKCPRSLTARLLLYKELLPLCVSYLGCRLCELLGFCIPGAALQEEAGDVDAVLRRGLVLLSISAHHHKVVAHLMTSFFWWGKRGLRVGGVRGSVCMRVQGRLAAHRGLPVLGRVGWTVNGALACAEVRGVICTLESDADKGNDPRRLAGVGPTKN